MKHTTLALATVLSLTAAPVFAQAQGSKIESTPQWEKIKTLVGEWEGYNVEEGQKIPTHISVRMTGDGSAVMHLIDSGTPHEMVTIFYMDKSELLATHYCSAHNQPRLRAVPSSQATQVAFEFKDGTNIRPGDGYMRQLAVTFLNADHHDEAWGYVKDGKIQIGVFHLTRVKQPVKR